MTLRSARSKYNAKTTMVDGMRFASQSEATRYRMLLLVGEYSGQIRNLELQPRFPLVVNGVKVGTYVADFRYEELVKSGWPTDSWVDVVEDVKGMKTPIYRLKAKLLLALYGITIRETT